jgi:hypothetical protein
VAPVVVPAETYRSALRRVRALDREVRLDPPVTLGVSTEWFTLSAFRDGDWTAAHRYADYERAEFGVSQRLVTRWLDVLLEHVIREGHAGAAERAQLVVAAPRKAAGGIDGLAALAATSLHGAIDARDENAFEVAQEALRAAHITANDLSVQWIQDLLTLIAESEGEDAVEQVMAVCYVRIWKERYGPWFGLTARERLALSSEGMRSHYGGPGRRGDFTIDETDDAFIMTFDPCGTGGVLRRGDPARDQEPYVTAGERGTNKIVHPWSFGMVGVPWYCTHCPMLLEYFPLRDFGRPIRPVVFDPDPRGPTRWVVTKDVSQGPTGQPTQAGTNSGLDPRWRS